MGQTLSEAFEIASRRHATAVAIYDSSRNPVSFENFFFTVIAFAEALQDRGVRPGQLVAVHISDAIAGVALRFALLRLGATAITLPQQPVPEDSGFHVEWHLIATGTPAVGRHDISVDSSWIRSPKRMVPIVPGGKLVRATSGTTGQPKFRLITDEGALARVARGSNWRGQPEGTIFVGYAPTSTPFFNHMARALLSGVAQVHAQQAPEASLRFMGELDVTTAFLSPSSFFNLLKTAENLNLHPRALRSILVGGGEVSPSHALRAEQIFGCEVLLCYGSNETGSMAHFRSTNASETPGVVGAIYPDYETRFVGDDGQDRPPTVGGELWLRVPEDIRVIEFPSGAPICDPEGWVGTGDLGRLLPDGSLVFLGRKVDLLNVGGNKRAPRYFENIARQYSGINDIAAFRVPADGGGDEVGLAVIPAGDYDASAFAAHMLERLGPHYPFHIVVVSDIPTTTAGKVDRKRLSAEHLAARERETTTKSSHSST